MQLTFGTPFLDQGNLQSLEIEKCVGRHSRLSALVGYAGADMPDDPAHLIGARITCRFQDGDCRAELFWGVVTSMELIRTPSAGRPRMVRVSAFSESIKADLVPRCRVFQDPQATIADVIDEVFSSADYRGERARGDFSWPMPLSVQYRETDFQYLKRILTAAGIPLVADDGGARILAGSPEVREHRLEDKEIVGDTYVGAIAPLLSSESYAVADGITGAFQNAAVKFADQLGDRAQYTPSGAHTASRRSLEQIQSVRDASELVMGTARYCIRTLRVLMAIGDQVRVRQDGAHIVASSLFKFSARETDRANFIQEYQLAAVQDLYPEPPSEAGVSKLNPEAYHFSQSRPWDQPIMDVPWRTTTFVARVVRNSGDPEALGRIQVKFDWEQHGSNGKSQCWVDVATPYAGQAADTHGFLMLPENGEHVLVRFIEPWDDKPIVVGSLRRGRVVDTLDTGQHKTICTPGGNCIDLVSDKGKETIRLRAGRCEDFHLVLETAGGKTKAAVTCNDALRISGKEVRIEGESVLIESRSSTRISAGRDLSLSGTTGTEMHSNTNLKIRGALVEIN
jgi:uncharacterized protein involved in type VI secretion and phage assembly